MNKILFVFGFFLVFSCNSFAFNGVDEALKILSTGSAERKTTLYKELYDYSGETDDKIFSVIAGYVEKNIKRLQKDRKEQEEYNWAVKALASSGNLKYQDLLAEVLEHTPNRKTKKHTRTALKNIVMFKEWNPVVNSEKFRTGERTNEQAKLLSLLYDGDFKMGTYAIRQAFNATDYSDKDFVGFAKQRLLNEYKEKTKDGYALDFQSWICRYLMNDLESAKHRDVVEEVLRLSPNKKVKKWARKSL